MPTKWFCEKWTFYVAYVKMTKFGTKIILFVTHVFFLYNPQKLFVFHEIVREHIEYRDVYADIFLHFTFCFWLKGEYVHGIKTTFPCATFNIE
jgi:hypothetical protein